jgi:UDP-4-amino-4-deoxy-L-arabinose formyltransferase/UDP-glucuronic acid dehydrogenase (UDP-4-keto-hexauronic acid decarboxylating)
VPTEPAERVREPGLADELRALPVDVLLNVHSLYLIAPEVLAAPVVGAFNLHPGPLPHYAGLNAPSWAIARGETRHAVTLHWMATGIDTGDVVEAAWFDLSEDDTGLSVSMRCAQLGLGLVDNLLGRLDTEPAVIPRHPQDLSERRYFGREVPHDGWIPWAAPAREVAGFVRACDYRPFDSPWGTPRTRRPDGAEVEINKLALTQQHTDQPPGRVAIDTTGDTAYVATGDRWVRLLELRVDRQFHKPTEVLHHGETVHGAADSR